MQAHQEVANLLDPDLRLAARQVAVLGETGELGMQGFEEEADFLGLVLGQDRLGRIAHRDRLALGDQRAQLFYASLEPGIGFLLQRQLLLAEAELDLAHELAGKALGNLRAAPDPVVEFGFQARFLQLAVFHHVVDIANGD
ncbi:Uncharacterised protein [Klebsiella pneumoniae]|nr:Uncharacterised protein [Klebsiella pneumoniae]